MGYVNLWGKCPLYGSNATGRLISRGIHYRPLISHGVSESAQIQAQTIDYMASIWEIKLTFNATDRQTNPNLFPPLLRTYYMSKT